VIVKGKIELTVAASRGFWGPGMPTISKAHCRIAFRNIGRDECELVSASSPPTFLGAGAPDLRSRSDRVR